MNLPTQYPLPLLVASESASPVRDAAETRARILSAARLRFSHQGYDQVGVREIASDAGVNPSLVNRYFGTKKKLFSLISASAFDIRDATSGPQSGWGAKIASYLMSDLPRDIDQVKFDPLQLFLRSALSQEAGPIVNGHFRESFILPLSRVMPGEDARMRAAMIAAYVMGFATMRFALRSPELNSVGKEKITMLLGDALQACVDGNEPE